MPCSILLSTLVSTQECVVNIRRYLIFELFNSCHKNRDAQRVGTICLAASSAEIVDGSLSWDFLYVLRV